MQTSTVTYLYQPGDVVRLNRKTFIVEAVRQLKGRTQLQLADRSQDWRVRTSHWVYAEYVTLVSTAAMEMEKLRRVTERIEVLCDWLRAQMAAGRPIV
jgi:hypothetical protein